MPKRRLNAKLDPEADYLLTIVARLLRWPDRPIRADEISELAGCSVRTAYRLILRLKAAGIIRAASRGHYQLAVRPRPKPRKR